MKEQSKANQNSTQAETKPSGFILFGDIAASVDNAVAKVPDSKNGRSNVAKMSLEQTRAFFASLPNMKDDIRAIAEAGFKPDVSGLKNYKSSIANAMLIGFLFSDEQKARNALASFYNANHMKDAQSRLGFVFGTVKTEKGERFGVIDKKVL